MVHDRRAAMTKDGAKAVAVAAGGFVLFVLATGQFVMTLDSSVMNVSIATVAKDVGTTVTVRLPMDASVKEKAKKK